MVVLVVGLDSYNTEEVMMPDEDDGQEREKDNQKDDYRSLSLDHRCIVFTCRGDGGRRGGDYREVVTSEMPQMAFSFYLQKTGKRMDWESERWQR